MACFVMIKSWTIMQRGYFRKRTKTQSPRWPSGTKIEKLDLYSYWLGGTYYIHLKLWALVGLKI
ncbi:hypothetical protein GP486_001276 [Trichoglossum hirsutum]|uniref:Uncharacterized protein n=1 Tax=Trichoglossum hirsutum TaxID=265104 RepID=A0A9P8LHB3_9PEZI|nr:hypothetical protein GP486_001276 [Trichoglossum hirsutum]